MKRLMAAAVLTLVLADFQAAQEEKNKRLVLPNPKLLRCKSADCFQLWAETPTEPSAIFPKQLSIDMRQNCLYGMTATYDKSVSLDDVKAAIDERYGKWALAEFANLPIKLWKVEPEKFVIQLHERDKRHERLNVDEAGTKQAIHIAFGAACDITLNK